MTDLGTLGGSISQPVAINEAGQVMGYSQTVGGTQHAFVWDMGVMSDLTLGGSNSYAYAINEAGRVLGQSSLAGDASFRAFVWDSGVMTELGTLGGSNSQPVAINESGQVTGYSYLVGDVISHAFVANIANTPMCNGQAATIYVNAEGIIVGGPDNGKLYKHKLEGTSGVDVIVGTSDKDDIDAKAGNDVVCGGGANDVLEGAGGNDHLFVLFSNIVTHGCFPTS